MGIPSSDSKGPSQTMEDQDSSTPEMNEVIAESSSLAAQIKNQKGINLILDISMYHAKELVIGDDWHNEEELNSITETNTPMNQSEEEPEDLGKKDEENKMTSESMSLTGRGRSRQKKKGRKNKIKIAPKARRGTQINPNY